MPANNQGGSGGGPCGRPSWAHNGALLALTLGIALAASPVFADATAGRAKAAQCAVCHGPNGIATLPGAPNLAGQNEIYLIKALQEFKTGVRKDEMMSMMAARLSDADIEDLAAYYQSIEIVVKNAP